MALRQLMLAKQIAGKEKEQTQILKQEKRNWKHRLMKRAQKRNALW